MNPHHDDIEELEGPFEQIAGVLASDGSNGSIDPKCEIKVTAPRYTCCSHKISVTADVSAVCPLSSVVITDPAGNTKQGAGSVTVEYTPRDQDCGKEITFKARADCVSGTKDILVSVVKIEFSELKNTDGNPQWRQSTDPVGTAGHYLSASTNFTGKVKLTPAPPTKDDIPYEIQLSQYQNTHEVERYRTANPTVSETVEDDKKKRDDAFDKVKQNVTYDYNGVLTVTGEDEPGAFIPDSRLDKLIFVTTEFYFNLYLEWRCKADSDGLWIPLGLLFWEWNGEAARDNTGAIAPNGPIFPSDGKSYSGTEKPPNKPQ